MTIGALIGWIGMFIIMCLCINRLDRFSILCAVAAAYVLGAIVGMSYCHG